MTPRQLPLDLPAPGKLGRADFLPAASNEAALAAIGAAEGWPDGRMIVAGPVGSGRSHLGRIFAAETGAAWSSGAGFMLPAPAPAYVVDDADAVAGDAPAEEALFHLLNRAQADGAALLMTARDTAGTWGLRLPDLQSRLLACAVTRTGLPDEALMEMVLVKLFDERQLLVGPETIAYLVARLDRSLATAQALVAALDRAALSRQKRISRALAADALADVLD